MSHSHSNRFPLGTLLLTLTLAATVGTVVALVVCGLLPGPGDGAVRAVLLAGLLTWALFIVCLGPMKIAWGQPGLAVARAYLTGAALRAGSGLAGSVALVWVADQPPVPTLTVFAGVYLAAMFSEIFVIIHHLGRAAADPIVPSAGKRPGSSDPTETPA